VSVATASRVFSHAEAVSDGARSRVLAAAAELGYSPLARPRAEARAASVALLIPDIVNPFFAEVIRGVQDELADGEFVPLVLDTVESAARERQFLRLLAGQAVQGVIVLGSRILGEADIDEIRQSLGLPLVFINRSVRLPNVASIRVNFAEATFRATRHLLDLNHQRIAYLPGPRESEASHARQRGVEQALAQAGLCLRPEYGLHSFPSVEGGFEAMSGVLGLPPAEQPTAVIAYNDLMALGVLHAIRSHHLRVPDDISVIGIDDIVMAAHSNPPLTTIAQPKYRLGRLAMNTLRRMIAGQPPAEESYVLVESPLIVRASTGPARTGAA
jgi:LacI family transcriptional regulator